MADNQAAETNTNNDQTLNVPPQLQPLIDGVKRLYSSEDYTDLTITCQGHEWKVHKFYLCANSEYFQKLCGGFFKEANDNRIHFDDDDPHVMKKFIHYLYNFDYEASGQTELAPIVLDVRMFAIADRYFVTPLKQLAATKFAEKAKKEWESVAFADAVAEVYTTIPEGDASLRQIVVHTVKANAKQLLDTTNPSSNEFIKVLRRTPELGAEILTANAEPEVISKAKTYMCGHCDKVFTIAAESGTLFSCPDGCDAMDHDDWAPYIHDE